MTADEQPRRRTLAEKINHLFHTIHPSGRGEHSNEEVAAAIRKNGGPTISATYLWQLRKGIRDNPTKKHLEALAEFFGVSPSYFFDEAAAARIDAELKLLVALRDSPVRRIALRAFGLSPESLEKIAEMVEWVRELERLPGEPSSPQGATPEREVSPDDSE
jgi:transcriptional regulator with XRE-family HTH domain